jgi:hypothetical protein
MGNTPTLTHADLVQRAAAWLASRRHAVVLMERSPRWVWESPDAFGVRSPGIVSVIECKTSRADFMRDAHKPHAVSGMTMGDERWYMTPPGLLDPAGLPADHGLLEVHSLQVRTVVKATPRAVTVDQMRKALAFLYDHRRCVKCDGPKESGHLRLQMNDYAPSPAEQHEDATPNG